MLCKMDTEYSGMSLRGRLEPFLDCQERQGIIAHAISCSVMSSLQNMKTNFVLS